MADQFVRDLLIAAHGFIQSVEGVTIPFSSSVVVGNKGHLDENGTIYFKSIPEGNLVVNRSSDGDGLFFVQIHGIHVYVPEIAYELSEDWGPNITTAGYVEVEVTKCDLLVRFSVETNAKEPSLNDVRLVKTHTELKQWEAKILPHSHPEKAYAQNSSITKGRLAGSIEAAVAQDLAKKFSEKLLVGKTTLEKVVDTVASVLHVHA